MRIVKKSYDLIGNTPLLEIENMENEFGLLSKVFVKLEGFNPAGSVKDRVALNMIEKAEEEGKLKKGSVIIEPTSGNTGIGLSSVAAAKGYRTIIVMPDTMSVERRQMIAAFGAEIVLTDGKNGMKGAIEKAEELKEEMPGSFIPGQFVNPDNPEAHYRTTGPEIWTDTDGNVDIFISAVGTGGTLTGCGRYLKEKNPSIKVIAVEPVKSPVLSGGNAGPHGIQGIGAGFIPDVLDTSLIDEIIAVTDEDAFSMGRLFAHKEGILVGVSSGAALSAAMTVARRKENKEKNIVVIMPDNGDRYLSSKMFALD